MIKNNPPRRPTQPRSKPGPKMEKNYTHTKRDPACTPFSRLSHVSATCCRPVRAEDKRSGKEMEKNGFTLHRHRLWSSTRSSVIAVYVIVLLVERRTEKEEEGLCARTSGECVSLDI